jgi:hypothetical protein
LFPGHITNYPLQFVNVFQLISSQPSQPSKAHLTQLTDSLGSIAATGTE